MKIFDQGHTRNENLEDNSEEDDFDNYWETKHIAKRYISGVLALSNADK